VALRAAWESMVAGDRIAENACSEVEDGRISKDGKEKEGFLVQKTSSE
jgi:hypothetical protein